MSFKTTATIASFGGKLLKLTHTSSTLSCDMALNLYLPPSAESSTQKIPVLFYLAGLTCTGDNGAEKGFFQKRASEKGIAIVYPDTSPPPPRVYKETGLEIGIGIEIAVENEKKSKLTKNRRTRHRRPRRILRLRHGAGFYINATRAPWSSNYKMESYITSELPTQLFASFPSLDSTRQSITGHSMGGHGALTLFLKNPGLYKSVSAFAPISNPVNCPWGQKAFAGYLGEDKDSWKAHDASELLKGYKGKAPFETLIDVGTGDNFYKQGQLLPENFVAAAKESGNEKGVVVRYQDGYDHSYFFISTFSTDHVNHAAKHLFA
ncbi:S-formylglutathione hydrolase [Lachnellula hyalina]|uniref:S-formylglutathione hydrolase n=1 Tax=Lachnellula hyalina TaxID=1316788 RepID=A0A8H8R9G2_9HELO|nr:S-formylglutathione hydrolase [Lachnellula hyalina]TVY30023.1 S-formylglutathione hydrolase [Lachnellula hyalina]